METKHFRHIESVQQANHGFYHEAATGNTIYLSPIGVSTDVDRT